MTRETAGSRPAARYLDGPVAIIGAGIGGLTAALSLQHFGVPVRVFEQARALREIGAGVTITPNAMNVPRAIIADPYALYVGAGRSLIHYPLRRRTTMNLLGNAQATQWQAEGWSIPATVQEFLGLFDDFPESVRKLIAAVP